MLLHLIFLRHTVRSLITAAIASYFLFLSSDNFTKPLRSAQSYRKHRQSSNAMATINKVFVRLSGPWPFPDDITADMCRFAGREASAALYTVLGETKNGGPAARQAMYYEPFTYWDWKDVHPDKYSTRARGLKNQPTWKQQRSFRQMDYGSELGYQSPRTRWQMFKSSIERFPERGLWVQRVAVAHWMDHKDLNWIAGKMTNLSGLDMSDTLVQRTDLDDEFSSTTQKDPSLSSALTSLLRRLQ